MGLNRHDTLSFAILSIEAQKRHERRERVYRDDSAGHGIGHGR